MPWVKTDVGGVVGFHVKSSFWAGVPCQIFRLGGGTMSNLVKSSLQAGVPLQIFDAGGRTMRNLRFRWGYHVEVCLLLNP